MKPLLLATNPQYFYRLLDWKNKSYTRVGHLAMLPGYDSYNKLIELNALFSNSPTGDPVDRTCNLQGPFNFGVTRKWEQPTHSQTLDEVIEQRVRHYLNTNKYLNLCWSGGIDSTCLVAGFLKHAKHLDQLRILYTPFSIYENRNFFEFIKKNYPKLELLDMSGDVYLDKEFEGTLVNGHGGDEFTASLDESFFERHGYDVINKPWRSLIQDPELQDFCKNFFALAGRPIDTVLEARWWFYSVAKSHVFAPKDSLFTSSESSAFFDCKEFEDYMWYNTDKIITGANYNTYKKFLKQYIYNFNHDDHYFDTAQKFNSFQFRWYTWKKSELKGQQWIACLTDNTLIRTPSLPLLSRLEFEQTYGDSLEYLFNFER